jgi:hypothetical protein
MEGRNSPVRSMAPELNGGEGVTFLVWEVAPELKEALGPTQWESGGVRQLGTDEAVENRGGEVVLAYRRRTRRECGRDAEVAYFYSRVSRRSNAGLLKEGEREVTAQRGDKATVCSRSIERSKGSNGKGWHAGDAKGIFVRTSVARR